MCELLLLALGGVGGRSRRQLTLVGQSRYLRCYCRGDRVVITCLFEGAERIIKAGYVAVAARCRGRGV
jgi:hypothetical protein